MGYYDDVERWGGRGWGLLGIGDTDDIVTVELTKRERNMILKCNLRDTMCERSRWFGKATSTEHPTHLYQYPLPCYPFLHGRSCRPRPLQNRWHTLLH